MLSSTSSRTPPQRQLPPWTRRGRPRTARVRATAERGWTATGMIRSMPRPRCCPGGCHRKRSLPSIRVSGCVGGWWRGWSFCVCGVVSMSWLRRYPAAWAHRPHALCPTPAASRHALTPPCPAVERSSGAVLHGKTSPINRKRVLSEAAAGQPPVWVCVEQYSVLFTIAGPPPSRWGSLLAGRSPASCAQRRELHAVLAGRALASCWLDAQVAPPRVASLCASAASCGACCAPPQRRPRRPCLSMPPRRSLWCRHAGTAASRVSSSARPATRCCCSPVTGRRRERARSLWPPSWRRRCRCGGAAPGRGAAASWRLLRAAGRAPAAAGGVCVQRGAACVACQPGPARS